MSRVLLVFFLLPALCLAGMLTHAYADAGDALATSYGQSVGVLILDDGPRPATLRVGPGVTVSWVNRSQRALRIRFVGERVSTTCKAPRGFELKKAGVYKSERIEPGGLASICFLEPSKYPYSITFESNDLFKENESARRLYEETPLFEVVLPQVLECRMLLSLVDSQNAPQDLCQGLIVVDDSDKWQSKMPDT